MLQANLKCTSFFQIWMNWPPIWKITIKSSRNVLPTYTKFLYYIPLFNRTPIIMVLHTNLIHCLIKTWKKKNYFMFEDGSMPGLDITWKTVAHYTKQTFISSNFRQMKCHNISSSDNNNSGSGSSSSRSGGGSSSSSCCCIPLTLDNKINTSIHCFPKYDIIP